jgi:nicotinamidase/pyrazinamidase
MMTDNISSSPSSSGASGTTLLLVDVQRDFHPGGNLAIPSANDDASRIAKLIRTHGHAIKRIIATLDSHHKLHIANPCFWYDKDHRHPAPFTIITADDIKTGKWTPRSNLKLPLNEDFLDAEIFSGLDKVVNEDNEFDLKMYCIEYARQLEKRGRFKLCIWPEHCLIGHQGHCVVDEVRMAMDEWSETTGGSIEWIFKGQNLLTEMYSALQAEVPICAETDFNEDLMEDLLFCDRLLVCGQAM